MPTDIEGDREEHRALVWAAGAAVVVILWLVMPIGVGILLGTFLAFMCQPVFVRLSAWIGDRGSAAVTVVGSTLALGGAFAGLAWLFVSRGTVLANDLIQSFGPGGIAENAMTNVSKLTERFGVSREDLVTRARGSATELGARAGEAMATLVSMLGSALLGLLFAMLAMHYMLRNWQSVSRRAQDTFPLRPEYTATLFTEFRNVGRTTLLGAGATSLAQGVFATIGYAIAGVPEPMFFGAATAIASFVPAVGVLLVLVPVTTGLFLTGSPGHGIVMIIWGVVVVVGICDYVIRPRLVRGETKVPSLVTFAALFGGIEVFGLKGLIVGPVLMALAISILRLYAAEARKRQNRTSALGVHKQA